KVAASLRKHFRDVDIICRIGGDEFVVIMTRVSSDIHTDIVAEKVDSINEELKITDDGLPPVSISVGVAFADRDNPEGDIFKDADTALYRVKNGGGNGYSIY
ncbi:MAG: GGDEF domain-containing protein, partial [Clostridia bacterium]|nr:GGDEF domain-containing protein [Clostridia bacterium]